MKDSGEQYLNIRNIHLSDVSDEQIESLYDKKLIVLTNQYRYLQQRDVM